MRVLSLGKSLLNKFKRIFMFCFFFFLEWLGVKIPNQVVSVDVETFKKFILSQLKNRYGIILVC